MQHEISQVAYRDGGVKRNLLGWWSLLRLWERGLVHRGRRYSGLHHLKPNITARGAGVLVHC